MSERSFDLSTIFGTALQGMLANRQEVNELDGYNGNHGDNMVANLELILNAVQARPDATPSAALAHASQQVREAGHGSTSQYYARGLEQAAQQLLGHNTMTQNDLMVLVQTLLGSIPAEGYPEDPNQAESVLSHVLRQQQPVQQAPSAKDQDDLDMGDVIGKLLPVGLAFLSARQSGADTQQAVSQALMQAVLGQSSGVAQAKTPRAAAGTVIAQSILRNLLNG